MTFPSRVQRTIRPDVVPTASVCPSLLQASVVGPTPRMGKSRMSVFFDMSHNCTHRSSPRVAKMLTFGLGL